RSSPDVARPRRRGDRVRRREFIAAVGGAAAWPLVARAQQVVIVGVLSPLSAIAAARNMDAFRRGLRGLGYAEGGNITLEFRYADGDIDRLPALAAALVGLRPAVIVAGSPAAAKAAQDATQTIPIVMNSSRDPVAMGLVRSIRQPDGNVTGFWFGD